MATVKLQDNLPITGRLEKVWYQPPKDYGAQLKLVGRWQEQTVNGVVDHGAGNIYVSVDLESDLRTLGLVEISSNPQGEPVYKVLQPGPIRLLKAPTGDGNKRRTTVTLVAGAPPTTAAPALVATTPAPAAPSPPPAPAEGRRQQFADWVSQGDALAAGLALAAHAARVAGVATTPESLQAGAATLLIRAERTGLQAWRGLGEAMVKYLADRKALVPRAIATATDMQAELDRRRGVSSGPMPALAGVKEQAQHSTDGGDDDGLDLPF